MGDRKVPPVSDPVAYITPDFGQFVPATQAEIGPAFNLAIEHLLDVTNGETTGAEQWNTEWWEVWKDPLVFGLGWCCGCVLTGRMMEHVSGKPCEGHCCAGCLTCCLALCYVTNYRTQFREKYNIAGSPQMDCLLGWCCGPCLRCQETREIRHRTGDFSDVSNSAPKDENMS